MGEKDHNHHHFQIKVTLMISFAFLSVTVRLFVNITNNIFCGCSNKSEHLILTTNVLILFWYIKVSKVQVSGGTGLQVTGTVVVSKHYHTSEQLLQCNICSN